tara:strand:+ start:310 stop:723 length:414 start_codon:yes stop_codon:yes gene_type:complete
MTTKTVYNLADGSATFAHEDQVTAELFNIPAGATETKPPSFNAETQTCQFIDDKWVVADIPVPEVEPEPEPIPAMDQLRVQRSGKLAETDWQASSDLTMTQAQIAYRQALRDLPSTATPALDEDGQLTGVTWPVKPS